MKRNICGSMDNVDVLLLLAGCKYCFLKLMVFLDNRQCVRKWTISFLCSFGVLFSAFSPSQSFAKVLPLPPPFLLRPRWTGRFKGWWQHLFLRGKKGRCHHLSSFSFGCPMLSGCFFSGLVSGAGDAYGPPCSS